MVERAIGEMFVYERLILGRAISIDANRQTTHPDIEHDLTSPGAGFCLQRQSTQTL
jgi:hypothetical protein